MIKRLSIAKYSRFETEIANGIERYAVAYEGIKSSPEASIGSEQNYTIYSVRERIRVSK